MSVINQVLKDLDERQPLSSESGKYQSAAEPQAAKPDTMRFIIWVLVAVLLLAAAGYYFWLESQVVEEIQIKPVTASVAAENKPRGEATVVTVVTVSESIAPMVVQGDEKSRPVMAPVEVAAMKPEPEKVIIEDRTQAENTAELNAVESKPRPKQSATTGEKTNYLPLHDDGKPVAKAVAEVVVVKTPSSPLQTARDMLSDGRLTEAEKALKKILDKNPGSLAARELLIGLLLRNNRVEEAAKQILTGLKYYPFSENLILMQSKILLERGQQGNVIKLLEQYLDSGKAGIQSIAMLASLYQQNADYTRAYDLYNRLASRQPADYRNWMGLAISLEGINQPGKAIGAYKKALQSAGLPQTLYNYALSRINNISQQDTVNE
jgi:MSHA biogenesis protein MshN